MGLYLCVFDGDDEIEGVDVGAYSDFDFFRSTVTELLEEGNRGSKYPTLSLHADSDGEWSPEQAVFPACGGMENGDIQESVRL